MKNLYFAIIILFQATYAIGQCPTMIDDDGGDGTVYYLTLADGTSECANYSADITINGVTYEFSFCDADFDEVAFTIAAGGTAVIIADDAPITIVNGATTCGYDASGNPAALPVELISFDGVLTEYGTNLTWQTASEENNKGFEVERSTNGDPDSYRDWETLDFVFGNGTTLETQNYTYTDENPIAGINYYRLKQIDYDGEFEYSEIRTVELGLTGETIKIFPNPAHNRLTITNTENVEQAVIYNTLGQVVQQISLNQEQNEINVSELRNGIYTIQFQTTDGRMKTRSFIKR